MSYFFEYYGIFILVILAFTLSGIAIVFSNLIWWVYCIFEVALPISGLYWFIDAFSEKKNRMAKILTGIFSVFGCWLIHKAICFSEVFAKYTEDDAQLKYQDTWSLVIPVLLSTGIIIACIYIIYEKNHAFIPVVILTIVLPLLLCIRAYFVRFDSVKNNSDHIEAYVTKDIDKLKIRLELSRRSILSFDANVWVLEIPVHLYTGETVYLTHPIENSSSEITIYTDKGLFGRVSANTVKEK